MRALQDKHDGINYNNYSRIIVLLLYSHKYSTRNNLIYNNYIYSFNNHYNYIWKRMLK